MSPKSKTTTQQTIAQPVEHRGVGLHTGMEATVRLIPAEAGTGLVFVRTDLAPPIRIPVCVESLGSKERRTYLEKNGAAVHTIEHLLAALSGLRIDNLEIEIDNIEVPGCDGSSMPYVKLIRDAGIRDLGKQRTVLEVTEPVAFRDDNCSIVALPSTNGGLAISYTLDYPNTPMPVQHFNLAFSSETFEKEIASARTFCLESEAQKLQESGLGKGANYENTLVLGEEGVIQNELRFQNEFVRHKVLDLVGDLSLLGADLNAQVIAIKTGHSANLELVKRLVKQSQSKTREKAESSEEAFEDSTGLGIKDIQKILPHRYPFLLVDRVTELDGYRRAVGIKNVTFNEPFFSGHFPGQPVMPGVLIFEALAQLAGVLLLRKLENTGKLAMLVSLDKARIRKIVIPGDQLILEAITVSIKSRIGQVAAKAKVRGKVVAEAQMRFMLVDE